MNRPKFLPTTGRRRLAALGAALVLSATAQAAEPAPEALDGLVREAMHYAYPYQEFMKMRHEALTDKAAPTYTTLNSFRHARQLATPADRWANGPINDTFYSTNWFDLGTSPVILSVPETHGRYYVLALVGADLNTFGTMGRRVSGTAARRIAIVAPDWRGPLPEVDQLVRAPTRDVYVNMRVLVDGPDDLAAAHAVQDGFKAKSMNGAVGTDEPRVTPSLGNWQRFVDVSNESLSRNPPPASEAALLARLAQVGICGKACSWAGLPATVQARWLALAPQIEIELKSRLNADQQKLDPSLRNGWVPFRLPVTFGSNYSRRATSAAMSGGILGLEAAEATYFAASLDGANKALGGGMSYRLHLPEGRLPSDAFWSITLYEFVTGGQYMVENPINRYSIGDRTRGLQFNADGSLDIWIGPTDPGPARRANWLPSPKSNNFYLMARAYQPWPVVLDPQWSPAPVEPIKPE